jgi:hypothetical protein
MIPSVIEPATFRFVAQYLNHCATISGPLMEKVWYENINGTMSPVSFYDSPCTESGYCNAEFC